MKFGSILAITLFLAQTNAMTYSRGNRGTDAYDHDPTSASPYDDME